MGRSGKSEAGIGSAGRFFSSTELMGWWRELEVGLLRICGTTTVRTVGTWVGWTGLMNLASHAGRGVGGDDPGDVGVMRQFCSCLAQ